MERKVFGPVPSRRLGNSLGINNIPHKHCSYSCSYCQVGKAFTMQVDRQKFYEPEELYEEVKILLASLVDEQQLPDYLAIVPDGEPTLDIMLGRLIELLQPFQIPVAVITNASLLHLPGVREDLLAADYVSIKVDAIDKQVWKRINKPHRELDPEQIREGIEAFVSRFAGKLVTETMLVDGINTAPSEYGNIAAFIQKIDPSIAYISVPIRPPAFAGIKAATSEAVTEAFHVFSKNINTVELLTGYEGNAFSSTGSFRNDILSITAVHPMREDAVMELLKKTGDKIDSLDTLLREKNIEKLNYSGHNYYIRKFKK